MGLIAKNEFCNPKGIGVSLDNKTNWNASFFELSSICSFLKMDPEFELAINLKEN